MPRIIYLETDVYFSELDFEKQDVCQSRGETFDLTNLWLLFPSLSVLLLKPEEFSHRCLHMAVAVLRLSETITSVKVFKAIMCLFFQPDLLRNRGGLESPSYR